ncbi:MAG: hypothetical protein J7497_15435, partial [Chitinophagaceae bacterium]|nr:hypothetical protein [Chitinophagaceae bacterium]
MRKPLQLALFFCILLFSAYSFSQNIVIHGNIRTSTTKEFVPAVSVEIKGTGTGTFSDDRGNFKITTDK